MLVLRRRSAGRAAVLLGLGLVGLGFWSCSDSGPAPDLATETPWVDGVPWSVGEAPTLSIGRAAGADHDQLFGVSGATRLRDDRIVIGNRGTGELRIYDPAGAFLMAFGSMGEGPGEFENLSRFWVSGDTLIAYDAGSRTLVTFSLEGGLVGETRLERRPGFRSPDAIGRFSDGSFLVRGAMSLPANRMNVLMSDTLVLAWYGARGEFRQLIRKLPDRPMFIYQTADQVHFSSQPFGAIPAVVARDTVVLLHDGRSAAGSILSREGRPLGTFGSGLHLEPLGEAEIEEYREKILTDARHRGPRALAAAELMLSLVPFPETEPPLSRLYVDRDGNLWGQRYAPAGVESRTWAVFGTEGWLGDVVFPERLRVLEIGSDYVLGVWRDEMDVEYVRMYVLSKGSGSPETP